MLTSTVVTASATTATATSTSTSVKPPAPQRRRSEHFIVRIPFDATETVAAHDRAVAVADKPQLQRERCHLAAGRQPHIGLRAGFFVGFTRGFFAVPLAFSTAVVSE